LEAANHGDLEAIAQRFVIPFYIFPIGSANKREQEQKQLNFWRVSGSDLLVWLVYAELSPDFTAGYRNRIIKIHHSFCQRLYRIQPYHQAYRRASN